MKRFGAAVTAAIAIAVAATPAAGQTVFNGSGCGGNLFAFCASWTGTYINTTLFSLFVTNTSGAGAGNPLSAFTQIGVGNIGVADPASMGAVLGWQYDANMNGFTGFGLLENQFGAITANGVTNALAAGNSLTFNFTLSSPIASFSAAQTAFAGAQIAIFDQGTPDGGACQASRGLLSNGSTFSGSCTAPVSTVPEPGTAAMAMTGLAGLVGFARRRRKR